MSGARYLIVGGGMTGDAAAKGIREHDPDGAIVVVGAEPYEPYARPPLTKKLWAGGDEDKIWRGTGETGAELRLGRRIVELDVPGHGAVDDAGEAYTWDKLLLATGGRPRTLPGAEGVNYFRSLDDYRDLRARAVDGAHVVVIGGGFIGSELAAAATSVGAKVTMVFPEPGIGWRIFPAGLSEFVTSDYRGRGVEVLAEESVASGSGTSVTLGDGRVVEADAVVAGLGILPETELAERAGLPVENGILVDLFGRVEGQDDVFAAGDVASFPSATLGRRVRVEHEDHAKSHGKLVGANMAGANEPYEYLPFFYSDLFDLGYEAVGELDSRLRTIEDWQEPYRKGIVTYVGDDGRPRGVLNWNVWDGLDAARELLREGASID